MTVPAEPERDGDQVVEHEWAVQATESGYRVDCLCGWSEVTGGPATGAFFRMCQMIREHELEPAGPPPPGDDGSDG